MVVIYCRLDKKNYKVFKFSMNNLSYFEIRAPFLSRHPISPTPQYFKIK